MDSNNSCNCHGLSLLNTTTRAGDASRITLRFVVDETLNDGRDEGVDVDVDAPDERETSDRLVGPRKEEMRPIKSDES
jgi:hypothetical protein